MQWFMLCWPILASLYLLLVSSGILLWCLFQPFWPATRRSKSTNGNCFHIWKTQPSSFITSPSSKGEIDLNVCSLDRLWSKSSLHWSVLSLLLWGHLVQKVQWVGNSAAFSRDVFVTEVCSWEYKFVKFIQFASVSGGNQTWATCAGSERFALLTVVSEATLKQAAETWSAW